MRRPQTHRSLELALEATVRTYRQMLWDDQPAYVEIWTEKDAIAGVLNEETAKWVVPLMVSRGFSSETFLYEAAETIKAQNKPAFLYYFGDYDPSGLLIDRTIANRLRGFAPAADIHFERVAVTESQIQEWKLPTRPTKKKGSHHKSFVGESVEVDAIDPEVLISLVSGCIRKHIDPRQLAVTTASEEQEKEDFQNFVRLFGSYQNAS
jgi:hypothetical protein